MQASVEDDIRRSQLLKEYPHFQRTGVPEGPSTFRQYLDEDLLTRHNLLRPSQYLTETEASYIPPSGWLCTHVM